MRELVRKIKGLPLFAQYFTLMSMIVVFMLMILFYSNKLTEREVTENYKKELQYSLNKSTGLFSADIQELSSIPEAIQSTRAYEYLLDIKNDPGKSPYILVMIQRSLSGLLYIQNNTTDSILYIPSLNSLVTRNTVMLDAEAYFSSVMEPSECYSGKDIISLLETPKSETILPVCEMNLNGSRMRAMGVICRPTGTDFSILCLYSEKTLLDYFNFYDLPEGSLIRLSRGERSLMEYADTAFNEEEKHIAISSDSLFPEFHVELLVPRDSYAEILKPVKTAGYFLILIAFMVGVVLCLILSSSFARPIRSLLTATQKGASVRITDKRNEYDQLKSIIDTTENEALALKIKLRDTLLTKAFSGALLTGDEEEKIRSFLPNMEKGCRVAIFHTEEKANLYIKSLLLGDEESDSFFCSMISPGETALLLPDSRENTELVKKSLKVLENCFGGIKVTCGLSSRIDSFSLMFMAVRQANIALLNTDSFSIYAGKTPPDSSVSFTQQERLRQCMISNDEDGAVMLIKAMASASLSPERAMELYYSLKTILRACMDEMGAIKTDLGTPYLPALSPFDNLMRLESSIREFFTEIRKKHLREETSRDEVIVDWIRENSLSETLTAYVIASRFETSEKNIYEIVKKQTGEGLHTLILKQRMKKAAELLCETNMNITSVAQACGYPAESTFYRVFKQYYKITPIRFRATGGLGVENNEPEK